MKPVPELPVVGAVSCCWHPAWPTATLAARQAPAGSCESCAPCCCCCAASKGHGWPCCHGCAGGCCVRAAGGTCCWLCWYHGGGAGTRCCVCACSPLDAAPCGRLSLLGCSSAGASRPPGCRCCCRAAGQDAGLGLSATPAAVATTLGAARPECCSSDASGCLAALPIPAPSVGRLSGTLASFSCVNKLRISLLEGCPAILCSTGSKRKMHAGWR